MSAEQLRQIAEQQLDNVAVFKPATLTTGVRPPDGVVLVNGADLNPEPIQWLWNGWLALGKLHLLAGTPGQGKTTIAMAMAATVTAGGRWPDGSRTEAGSVLIWSGEDDCADTLLPRLLAAGADKRRVFFVTGSRVNGEVCAFDPARDLKALQAETERIGNVRLIVVDPIVTAVTGDSHKNTETRRDLQPLVDLAANTNASLLGITHLSKGGAGGDPVQRVLGSVAFVAVARVVMVAAKVKSDEGDDKRILARGKSNIGPDGGGFEYHLEQIEPLPEISASRVMWGSAVNGTAQDLLAEPDNRDEDGGTLDDAKRFLTGLLSDEPVPSRVVKADADGAGYSWATIRRAQKALGVEAIKEGMKGGWVWRLPPTFTGGSAPRIDTERPY